MEIGFKLNTEVKGSVFGDMMKLLSLLIFVFPLTVFALADGAFEKTYKFNSYAEAQKSMNYIKFNMESTKLGMITTDFDGYAKEFKVVGTKQGNVIKKLKIIMLTVGLDTDNGPRDDKLHNFCMSAEKFKNIEISVNKTLKLGKEYPSLEADINIRGTGKKIIFPIKTKASEKLILAEGKFELNIDKLDIPDPSIFIAKVKKDIKIEYHVAIE